ncbi:hypothetical protein [Kribbella amoyensis]|uniref:hypothetical protein n=1 Tax=Kribbella amoyensis TaxID=996641 RepID=UPI0011A8C906|nr:hypothetical protein [Kribbella amoyensis]
MLIRRAFRTALALVAALVLAGAPAGPAHAHGVSASADLSIALTFGGNELTVILRRTPEVPGPLQVDVVAHTPVNPLTAELAARGVDQGALSKTAIALRVPGITTARLHVEQAGPHELELRSGPERAAIPFRVLVPEPAGWEYFTYAAFSLAGVFVLGGLGCAVLGARRPRVRAFAVPQAVLVLVALVAASTTAVLSKDLPPASPTGAPETTRQLVDPADGSAPAGRPYANLTLRTTPAQPRTGQPFTLSLRITDGNTGRPVDDLVAHHAALLHTVITSQDGSEFRHVHPVRTGPGELELRLTASTPGRHLLYAEFERADSGAQLVTGSFDVTGRPLPNQAASTGGGSEPKASIKVVPEHVVAGRPASITVQVGVDGRPVRDLQPWLGMAGHLVLRDERGTVFGHVHELASMAAQANDPQRAIPDESVAAEGPELRFTFSFPTAGRYLAWVQFVRDYRIHTVPFTVTVSKGQP